MAGYYNKDKDYSKELMRTDLSAGERAQLTQERQNKIDAVYGGKEPTLADGSGKTYNQKYGGSSSGGSSGGGSRTMPNGFQGSANGVGVWDADQDAIRDIMNSNSKAWWSADDTERERLHAANEALARLLNGDNGTVGFDPGTGYWSGDAGQKQQLLQFAFGGAPSYTSRYDEKLNELVDQILSRGPFSYDAENDPLYQFYQDKYQRNGDKAMRDTLGAQAARTGGLSSSYAGSVAQQSYNDYMQGLNDIVPELYKLAYSMYKDDEDSQRANVEMLRALEQGDYAKFQDLLAQYNTDRSFNYGVFSDARNFGYQQQRDNIEDSRYNAEWAYKLSNAPKNKTSGSGSTGSRGSTGSKDAIYDYEGLFRAAQASGNPKSWLAQKGNYTKYGFTSSSGLYADYQEWEANGGGLDESNLGKNGRPTFGDLRRSITQLVNQGNGSAAFDLYDKYFDDMSEKQRNELNQLLGYNGG
jgi:hypothetical protein